MLNENNQMLKTFWIVMTDNPDANDSLTRHQTRGMAETEATRIACRLHQRAYVLQAIALCEPIASVGWTTMVDTGND